MPAPSSGMNSMNHTVYPVYLANLAKSTMSSSFHPLISLKEIFFLEDLDKDHVRINKTADNSTIVVTLPQIYIEIKLDLSGSKATAMIDIENKKALENTNIK
jgi:hypothetical protein